MTGRNEGFDELVFEIVDGDTGDDFFTDFVGAGIGSGDNDGVAKRDFAVFFVAEDAFIENLKESGEDGGMGFFDFVEKDDGERLLHDLSGEAHGVGGAVADETANIIRGDKLVHIETDDVFFAVEINFGKGFGEFGLANAGGAEKEEGTDGARLIFDASASAPQGIGDGGDGFGLVNHAGMNELFEI